MGNTENFTKKQHYIPQVYLRGFSPDYRNNEDIPYDKYTICCYDTTKMAQMPVAVPIKSICYSKLLYEVTGADGEIVLQNHLEKCLCALEKMFGEYRSRLEHKVFIQDNFKTRCFLTKEENVFWVTFMLVQILRMPDVLNEAESVSKNFFKDVNDKQAKNIARKFCLPFFEELKEGSKESALFDAFFKPMSEMSFAVGVDTSGQLITSDKPVYVYTDIVPCEEYGRIIFPISSQICLFMIGGDDKKQYAKNFLFPIDDATREEIIKSMTETSSKYIYSNHPLYGTELKYIKEVLKLKKEASEGAIF